MPEQENIAYLMGGLPPNRLDIMQRQKLRAIVRHVSNLENDKKALSDEIKASYAAVISMGVSEDAFKEAVRLHKKFRDKDTLLERLDLYMDALSADEETITLTIHE